MYTIYDVGSFLAVFLYSSFVALFSACETGAEASAHALAGWSTIF